MGHHKEILVVCPTRGRYESVMRLLDSYWKTTSNRSDLVFIADYDDEASRLLWQKRTDFNVEVRLGLPMCVSAKVNLAAYDNFDRKLYCFVGNDVVFRTKGWEDRFLDVATSHKYALMWANDLHNREKLCVHWAMTGDLVRFLGWVMYPRFKHWYTDTAILELAQELNIAFYLDDVIIEHMHAVVNKSEMDGLYLKASEYATADRHVWEHIWKPIELPALVEELRPLV